MGKKIFVSGSIAYDFIMNYEGIFAEAILKDHIEDLNIAFVARNKKRHFGGCGGNICYNLSILGGASILYGVAGKDFDEYEKWLSKNNVDTDFVGIDPDDFTATAYLLTDKRENQITMFSPGAMESRNYEKKVDNDLLKEIGIAILSPDVCERSTKLGLLFIENEIPYIFDPGQMTPAFKQGDLKDLLDNAKITIGNSYEMKLIADKLSVSFNELFNLSEVFVETLGENGVNYYLNGKKTYIKAVKPSIVKDPTGCGDAFRAGFLNGYVKGLDIEKCCKQGAVAASFAIENTGTQSHKYGMDDFSSRLRENYNGMKG
jgi:adenosine kinase